MTTTRLKILVIDDSLAQAELIRDMLNTVNPLECDIVHVARIANALPRLLSREFDIALLDLNLPDSQGIHGYLRLRASGINIPIVVLTNSDDDELALKLLREGAQDYLLKRDVTAGSLARSIQFAVERKKAEKEWREVAERCALAVAGSNDGLWYFDLVANVAFYSARWRTLLGVNEDEISNNVNDWFSRVHQDDLRGLKSAFAGHVQGDLEHLENEHRLRTAAGNYVWVLCRGLAIRDANGKPFRIAGTITDITQRKQAEGRLIHDALHDSLTNLPNRALFMDRVELALKRFSRKSEPLFAVLFVDLDRFKHINDSLGHSIGDDLLLKVADRIERFLRPEDTLARLGGDEFGILISDVHNQLHAVSIAQRVQELFSDGFLIQDHEVFTTASLGIALGSSKYERAEDIVRDADLAMYRAKTTGAGKYQLFDTTMQESAAAIHRLQADLRAALEKNQFVIYYQPIVSLRTGRVNGFEALLRWEHPKWGLVSPEFFMEVAEESGLIVPISWWVLRNAAQDMRKWQEAYPRTPPLYVSVNVSGKLFADSSTPAQMSQVLVDSGLAADCLRLEVTERVIIDHADKAQVIMENLTAMGLKLHIDDFGTGYASLSYLRRFSYDSLKIDRSFVSNINETNDGEPIVKAIVALGDSLGMNVIAEGVETSEQAHRLFELNCPEAQGYWFCEPLDGAGINDYLDRTLHD